MRLGLLSDVYWERAQQNVLQCVWIPALYIFLAGAQESDGSIEDLSEEEREDYAAARRAKGKLPLEGPVLEEIETQEAEMRMQHDSVSD